MPDIIKVENVSKVFTGAVKTVALNNVNLEIKKQEFCSITGPSGSGKSTLLHLLAALDLPTAGEIYINAQAVTTLNDKKLTLLRQKYIGLVFQFHFLLPEFTALENLLIPQLIARKKYPMAIAKAKELLQRVGLHGKEENRPAQLSGGEQQRVAIARALINDPVILLADEPTGNLDTENSQNIYGLLRELNNKYQQTTVVVTHDQNFALQTDRIIKLIDGQIIP